MENKDKYSIFAGKVLNMREVWIYLLLSGVLILSVLADLILSIFADKAFNEVRNFTFIILATALFALGDYKYCMADVKAGIGTRSSVNVTINSLLIFLISSTLGVAANTTYSIESAKNFTLVRAIDITEIIIPDEKGNSSNVKKNNIPFEIKYDKYLLTIRPFGNSHEKWKDKKRIYRVRFNSELHEKIGVYAVCPQLNPVVFNECGAIFKREYLD